MEAKHGLAINLCLKVKRMSRLIDKLTRIRKIEPQPMGFMTSKPAVEKQRMQIIAYLNNENKGAFSSFADSVDAVMIDVARADDLDALEKICQSGEKVIGGGWLKASAAGTIKKAFNAACDFMVFPPATAVNLVPKEKLGAVLELDASLGDGLLRTVNDLPVEAVLIFGKEAEETLTLNRLMLVQRIAYMINKPILMSVSASYSQVELQAIWDVGISAVVVESPDERSAEKLAELRKLTEKLTSPASHKRDRMRAILPVLQPEPEAVEEREEPDEDE